MNDNLKVNINEYLPLRDVVFNTLRQAILAGELTPGERLMEIQLANRLGVSRTPVREAIRKLELEGLVVMVPRKGAEVAKITEKDLKDVLEVRCALEELVISLVCEKISKEQIDELKSNLNEFKEAAKLKDVTLLAKLDVNFHDIMYSAANNLRLIQILNNLREQMYRYRVEYLKDSKAHERLISEHENIIKCLEEKDVEVATKNIKEHIYNQVDSVIKNLKEQ